MKYLASLIVILLSITAEAKSEKNELLSMGMTSEGERAFFHFDFSKPVGNTEITANFIRRTIEWDMKDVFIRKDKKFLTLDKDEFKNIYISHKDADYLRLRVNLMPSELASAYHSRVSFIKKGKRLTLVIDKNIKLAKEKLDEFSRVYDVISDVRDSKLAAHLDSMTEMVAGDDEDDSAEAAAAVAEAANKDANLKGKTEAQIPLNLKKEKAAEAVSNPFMRLIVGLGVLALLLASVYMVSKKINRKRVGAAFNHDSIKVVSQKYLGPKKTLTLIRVAGEYILIGVTDHNINHIKTLSLVDDELPALEPNEFGAAVKSIVEKDEKEDQTMDLADEVEDSFTISSIDDVKKLMNDERI